MADNSALSAKDFELLPTQEKKSSEVISTPALTFGQDAWRRLKKNKGALISFWVLIAIFVIAFSSILWLPANPNAQHLAWANLAPKIPGIGINGLNGTLMSGGSRIDTYAAANIPDKYFIFGTDYLGRDLFSRVLYGTRISLIIALIATFFDLTIGVIYGMTSGWRGGKVDMVMQRIIEIISSIPNLVVIVLFLLIFKPGMTSIILAIAITSWTGMARLIRAQTMSIKEQEYILAARTLGETSIKIGFKHLLPNLSSTIIVQTMFTIPTAIFFEALLSYLGLGLPTPAASLGTLLNAGQKNFQFFTYQLAIPAIVLSIIMIAFNLMGDGLRDAFDPKTKD
jgi:oligopeptide transport system permease protein